ncbi:diguanylate cyclase [Dyella sp.]|uniref:tetratricopeptide repeat-containing diguanylate cyclase n=1 Tax=Dyella sp. TaxID=1869338 RepID=UPI002B48AAF8|nr:diguanylate cyclase [Dyella sp.]HKT29373.1 diguanylate cyclase [Dyella sp.]
MHTAGNHRRKLPAGIFLLFAMFAGATVAAPAPNNIGQLLEHAEAIKTTDNAGFVRLLQEIEARTPELSDLQKWRLRYLQGWEATYSGENDKAKSLLEAVINQAPDNGLRTRAIATLINVLGVGHHYEEAFKYLDHALDDLAETTDQDARAHVLAEASQLLSEAGQYDLAASYANQLRTDYPTGRNNCMGHMFGLQAELHGGRTIVPKERFQDAISRCLGVDDKLAADTIRRDMAIMDLQHNKLDEALTILQGHYEEVKELNYPDLNAEYNILLAQVYWKQGDTSLAQKFAMNAIDIASKSDLTEPLISAYQLLYQIERQYGNLRDALAYHEKYVAADKEHLDDVREKALAYQIVKQEVEAKKGELDTLNKQNQILQLQQALDHKAVVTSRLYITLLLTVLASIAFWLYRLKRSQLRFMRLARRDGLTGIFNRQHFVEEAEQTLRYVGKSLRGACLILIDLDHFKEINDTHGHVVGDAVLKRAVAVCQCHLNSCDVFGRLGGEEFGILLPECTVIQALERAERIRNAIQQVDSDEDVPLTASFGIAATAHYGYELRRLLIAADSALYRAKNDGRNRVVVSMDDYAPRTTGSSQSRHAEASPYANSAE